jgi:hypothetical protein
MFATPRDVYTSGGGEVNSRNVRMKNIRKQLEYWINFKMVPRFVWWGIVNVGTLHNYPKVVRCTNVVPSVVPAYIPVSPKRPL